MGVIELRFPKAVTPRRIFGNVREISLYHLFVINRHSLEDMIIHQLKKSKNDLHFKLIKATRNFKYKSNLSINLTGVSKCEK